MFLDALFYLLGKITFFAGTVLSGSSFPKPLSQEEERQAIAEMKAGSKEARDKLITHNMRLVAHVVKKYNGAAETDDLISVGSIGLIKAVNTYKDDKGTVLATFAARCIENEILMLLRSNKKRKNDVYLSDTIGSDKDGNELTLMDLIPDETGSVIDLVERKIERKNLIKLLEKCLNRREYAVISLRYGLKGGKPLPQREVAAFLKISRSYVSRIEKKAILKMRKEISENGFY